ncbi:MAG: D-tyrosyl-tRNA(Tyr) deacylase [Clostridia bacterium]|nr:D-tyrosyl-tRNA(Tyr) deacylase [Clostridia bacterium]
MKAVIQRVLGATLKVDGKTVSETEKGLVVFLGVGKGDTEKDGDFFVKKLPALRIFEDENGKINRSIVDEKGEILLVSQFTLFADTSHGNRPSFLDAENPDKADELYKYVGKGLERVVPVKYGVFGADMKIEQVNDGPFTVIMDSKR